MFIVSRPVYTDDGVRHVPKIRGAIVIDLEDQDSDLGFDRLKTEEGAIFRNLWEFSKVFRTVPALKQIKKTEEGSVVWENRSEAHIENGEVTQRYDEWRRRGLEHPVSVVYDNSNEFFLNEDGEKMDLIKARKLFLIKRYSELVTRYPKFRRVKKALFDKKNVIIIDKDGPHQESLAYYMGRYGVNKSFITDNCTPVTKQNLDIMLNDRRHSFGAGFALAHALIS